MRLELVLSLLALAVLAQSSQHAPTAAAAAATESADDEVGTRVLASLFSTLSEPVVPGTIWRANAATGITTKYSLHLLLKAAQSLPVREVSIDCYLPTLDRALWRKYTAAGSNGDSDLALETSAEEHAVSPRAVLADAALSPQHWRRVKAASLDFPLLVTGPPECDVLDGLHRLAKAHSQGRAMISVKRLAEEQLRAAKVGEFRAIKRAAASATAPKTEL